MKFRQHPISNCRHTYRKTDGLRFTVLARIHPQLIFIPSRLYTTSTWLALQSQRLSVAMHIASAWEIATELQLAGGGGEAPSSDEEGGATA